MLTGRQRNDGEMAKIKGVFKTSKDTPNGKRYYHYVRKGGPRFWIGGRDDDDQTPGYTDAYRVSAGLEEPKPVPAEPGKETVKDMVLAWQGSREWSEKAPRTQADYQRGLNDIVTKFGAQPARLFMNDPEAGTLVLNWIERSGWTGKEGDYRLDAIKGLGSWLAERHKADYPRSQFKGIKKFYKGRSRASIVWTDTQVDACIAALRQNLSDAVVFARDIGGRVGDLVKLGHQHVKERKDGRLAVIFETNKGRRHSRIMNVILTPRAEAIVRRTPEGQSTFLAKADGEPWGEKELAKEVMEAVRDKKLVPAGLRFNDLRGSRATQLAWSPDTSIGDFALQMGWGPETAARMMSVYASLNPDALKAPAESETPNSAPN